MNYIILDLEWNQSSTGKEPEVEVMPFEIIEIGALKLNQDKLVVGEFDQLVKPSVYHEMFRFTSQLVQMRMEELERGKSFPIVCREFLEWCGEDPVFCTWGPTDLTELQRNMAYHKMEDLAKGPIAFLDVQKLFSIAFEDRKTRRSLEWAVDYLQIDKDIPFHRAFSDAYYTTKILTAIKNERVWENVSYDLYHPPVSREDEVKKQFDTYFKYISREFPDKTNAFLDREVASCKCYICHHNLKKKIKWFTPNGRHYFCVAYCPDHGFVKGKIRVRKSDQGKYFVVKTTKFISEEDVESITAKREHARAMRHKKENEE